jgi:hypothetical protein
MTAPTVRLQYRLKNRLVSIKNRIASHPRKSFLVVAAFVIIVGSFVGYLVYVGRTATDYINTSKSFAASVVDYDGREAKVITSKLDKPPRLKKLVGGSFLSSSYREANTIDSLLQKYKSVANDIDKRTTRSNPLLHKQLSPLTNKHRASQSAIIKEQQTKETFSKPRTILLDVLISIRVETLDRIAKDVKDNINEANALDTSAGLDDVKDYYVSLLERDVDLTDKYKTMYQNAHTLGALDRLNEAYALERQEISDEIVVSVYSAYALQKDQFSLALSLQYALKDNLFAVAKDTYEDAELKAMTALYTRYARYAVANRIQASEQQINLGNAYFGLYMVRQQLDTTPSSNKVLISLLKKKVDSIKDSADLALIGQERGGAGNKNEDKIIDTTVSLTTIKTLSGFTVTARQVGREDKAKGAVIEIPETRKYFYDALDDMLPQTDLIKNELSNYQNAAKKCVDATLKFYEVSRKDFIELNKVEDERIKLIKSLPAAKTDEAKDTIRKSLDALKKRVAQVDAVRISAAATYKNEYAICTKEIESSQSNLRQKVKDTSLLRKDFYDKTMSLTDAIKSNTLK